MYKDFFLRSERTGEACTENDKFPAMKMIKIVTIYFHHWVKKIIPSMNQEH